MHKFHNFTLNPNQTSGETHQEKLIKMRVHWYSPSDHDSLPVLVNCPSDWALYSPTTVHSTIPCPWRTSL